MKPLVEYVLAHTERNSCRCGQCMDPGPNRDLSRPDGGQWDVVQLNEHHTVNMYFFDVCARENPTAADFIRLTQEHEGEFGTVNPLDNQEHNYIDLGGWIGDQGVAMQYMALGKILGVWEVMQPGMILNVNDPREKQLADQMAGMGMVSILPRKAS